jgi:hypothetical protein
MLSEGCCCSLSEKSLSRCCWHRCCLLTVPVLAQVPVLVLAPEQVPVLAQVPVLVLAQAQGQKLSR